jgi:hypothetical protein
MPSVATLWRRGRGTLGGVSGTEEAKDGGNPFSPMNAGGCEVVEQRRWGGSSAGRAPALQAGGHRFDPGPLHCGNVKPRRQHDARGLRYVRAPVPLLCVARGCSLRLATTSSRMATSGLGGPFAPGAGERKGHRTPPDGRARNRDWQVVLLHWVILRFPRRMVGTAWPRPGVEVRSSPVATSPRRGGLDAVGCCRNEERPFVGGDSRGIRWHRGPSQLD